MIVETAMSLALKKLAIGFEKACSFGMAAFSSDFWQLRAAHWITILLVLFGFYGGYSRLSSMQEQTAKSLSELAARVDAIDQRDTSGGRISASHQDEQININSQQIAQLQKETADLREKYVTILSRLDVIAALLEAHKQK